MTMQTTHSASHCTQSSAPISPKSSLTYSELSVAKDQNEYIKRIASKPGTSGLYSIAWKRPVKTAHQIINNKTHSLKYNHNIMQLKAQEVGGQNQPQSTMQLDWTEHGKRQLVKNHEKSFLQMKEIIVLHF
jgi:hypothetical protein